ncbi:G patch domain-containing protein 4-like [Physella acuta]|uniref:G patch domain-containing protein 4-like n=1 Tax=Physella acuta TaxID=109671 RepID=UPI0027DC6BA3|nr:G patch domain-containing protein 4-like [Physella acuta]
MAGLDFAKRMLKKQGWTEGSGLGKKENGMSEPIKVSLKMDKAGVGHDPGKEFTDHWWLRVFNEAAQKIGKQKDDKEQKPKTTSVNVYKGFVQSSTLTNGVEEDNKNDSDSSEDEPGEAVSIPTLDDIHKFCGGATGHRAAMFGIKMKGKLSRVAAQDQKFEETLNRKKSSKTNETADINPNVEVTEGRVSKKKKKKKKSADEDVNSHNSSSTSPAEVYGKEEINQNIEKKRKSKKRTVASEDKEALSNVEVTETVTETCKKKKKKKKRKLEDECEPSLDLMTQEQNETTAVDHLEVIKRKKKKKKEKL